jgi:hypothetical protein
VYALDCLQRSTPAQVRRHLVSLGYSADEAADAIRQAHAQQEEERPSAWSPEDAAARRCMHLGFLLFVFGVSAGCVRVFFAHQLPESLPLVLNVAAWGLLFTGILVFCIGVAQMRIRRP